MRETEIRMAFSPFRLETRPNEVEEKAARPKLLVTREASNDALRKNLELVNDSGIQARTSDAVNRKVY